ncbi:MAG: tRNA (adenosine(37)-N6)-threonylcarbamoyltransferase complex transferase subunit TsaD [Bacteriovoracaceae bacterium]|jgi:N6-L-threonylcarbamoyladenine synthase|nr:tRNA (adenosine(37)-N6)-threonylcarbamoyltransferase complex transferase subunit TsaD [Bacteriovoracaceae bacterium]
MSRKTLILGIETSCDDTSMAIIKYGNTTQVLAHKSFDQEKALRKWGGVVPEIAARNHLEKMPLLLDSIFNEAGVSIEQIDYIGVTSLPGLLGPLLTGLNTAKSLSLIYKKPIVPINHLYAHLEAIHIDQKVQYPYLGLLISGGHSIFFFVESTNEFKVLGSTIDDAAGEAFDKGAKLLGLGYPGGHIIDKLASFGDPSKYEFPIGLKSSADCRLSFSGLKTSLRIFIEKDPTIINCRPDDFDTFNQQNQRFYDVCASYQNAIVKALKLKLKYAYKKVKEDFNINNIPLVVGGGVACNSAIRSELTNSYKDVFFVSKKFCADNGAMIANKAFLERENALPFPKSLELDAKGRFINKKDFI